MQVRWLSLRGSGFTSDMAIDSISVDEVPACGFVISELPLSIDQVIAPGCGGGTDGSIEVRPTAGVGPYTYDWSTGSSDSVLTDVGAGTYTLTVTDSLGCAGSISVTVNEPLPLGLVVSATDVADCAGDSTGAAMIDQLLFQTSASALYTGGQISSDSEFLVLGDTSDCPALLAVPLPLGANVTSIDVTYAITAQGGAWQSEQRSWLRCLTTGIDEAAVTPGPSVNAAGTFVYTRTGLTIANGVVSGGVLEFELHLGRTWPTASNLGCNLLYNVGDNFEITVNYETTGGIGQLSYLWSTGDTTNALTHVTAGTYTVVLSDAAGCADTATVVIGEPAAISIATVVDETCEGDSTASISAIIAGGTGPLAYLWSTGVSDTLALDGLAAGAYNLTVTDSLGCVVSDSIEVIALPLPEVSLDAEQSFCEGDTLTIDAGAGFAAYAWSDGSSAQTLAVFEGGVYSLTVTDSAGCTSDLATTTVVTDPLPVVDLGPDTTIVEGTTLTLDAGADAASYEWSTGESSQTIEVSTAGTYSVWVTNAAGCVAGDTINVDVSVGILDAFVDYLQIYPNPSNGTSALNISLRQGGTLSLRLFDVRGRLVSQQAHLRAAGAHVLPLDLNKQTEEGVYLLEIGLDGRLLTTLRLIRN